MKPENEGDQHVPTMNGEKQCTGTTTKGDRCQAPEELLTPDEAGTLWCFSHHPDFAEERELARQRGGLRTAAKARRFAYLDASELPELTTPEDAQAFAKLVTEAVLTGRLSSAAAGVALKALDAFCKTHEAVEVMSRLDHLEAEAKEAAED